MGNKLLLPIKLTPKQAAIDASPKRFKVLKAGRRAGKTRYIGFWLCRNALRMPGTKHWYVTRTLALGREELWPHLLNLLPRDLVRKIDERLLTVWLTNGSSISVKTAEKEDNLRGRGLGSVALDEAAFIKERVWDQILRPQLADHRGPALIASSPKKGWFTTLFNNIAASGGQDAQWDCFHFTIYDNPHISPDEIEAIKAKCPANTWLQEYMAEEVSDQGQVYDEFSSRNIYNPSEMFKDAKTYRGGRGIDWGVADPTGVAWLGVSSEGYLVISEEHEQRGWDVPRHAEVIHSKSAGFTQLGTNVLDGTAFRKESSLVSVADQLRDAGLYCQRSERDVQASLAIMKRFIRGDGEKPWLYVSAKCQKLIQALQEWEHGDHEPDIAAACRYIAVYAVTHRWTRLSDVVPQIKSAPQMSVSEGEAKRILAQEARVVPVKKTASGFTWDFSFGVPS